MMFILFLTLNSELFATLISDWLTATQFNHQIVHRMQKCRTSHTEHKVRRQTLHFQQLLMSVCLFLLLEELWTAPGTQANKTEKRKNIQSEEQ